jgi:hypothetical protein
MTAPRGTNYLGIDASLTGLGLVCIPAGWDGDFSRVARETLGVTLPKSPSQRDVIRRMLDLSVDVRRFAVMHGATVAVIEDVPTHQAFNLVKLAELRGFIRSELARECGIYVEPVNQSAARKHFLGYLPTRKKDGPRVNRKEIVLAALDTLTDVFQFGDEKDAFITVNHRMARDPGVHVIELNAPNPNAVVKAAKKPRAKRAA